MSVEVVFTKGFGNNLFQYTFGRILAEFHSVPFFHPPIFNIPGKQVNIPRDHVYHVKTDWKRSDTETKQFYRTLFQERRHFLLNDYFEDFTLYLPHEYRIQSWFPRVTIKNREDLVVHFRAGDALLYKDNIVNFPTVEEWKNILDQIQYKQLYVVTDSTQFTPVNKEYIDIKINEICKQRRRSNRDKFMSNEECTEVTNKYINMFNEYNCKWVHHDDFLDDFNYLRQFDKILIGPSTFSWWACFLSDASEKYVYKAWRKGKGDRNKNLGQIPWIQW